MKVKTKNSIVTKISKKIEPGIASGESIGIEKFEAGFLDVLFEKLYHRVVTEGRENDFYEAAFQDVIDDGQKLYAIDVGDYRCIEIDTAEDMENAEKMVAKYIDRD